jgi:hypothetical protein
MTEKTRTASLADRGAVTEREFVERWRKVGEKFGMPKAMKLLNDVVWLQANKPEDFAAMMKLLVKFERKGSAASRLPGD